MRATCSSSAMQTGCASRSQAARRLADEHGVRARVIDLRWLNPLPRRGDSRARGGLHLRSRRRRVPGDRWRDRRRSDRRPRRARGTARRDRLGARGGQLRAARHRHQCRARGHRPDRRRRRLARDRDAQRARRTGTKGRLVASSSCPAAGRPAPPAQREPCRPDHDWVQHADAGRQWLGLPSWAVLAAPRSIRGLHLQPIHALPAPWLNGMLDAERAALDHGIAAVPARDRLCHRADGHRRPRLRRGLHVRPRTSPPAAAAAAAWRAWRAGGLPTDPAWLADRGARRHGHGHADPRMAATGSGQSTRASNLGAFDALAGVMRRGSAAATPRSPVGDGATRCACPAGTAASHTRRRRTPRAGSSAPPWHAPPGSGRRSRSSTASVLMEGRGRPIRGPWRPTPGPPATAPYRFATALRASACAIPPPLLWSPLGHRARRAPAPARCRRGLPRSAAEPISSAPRPATRARAHHLLAHLDRAARRPAPHSSSAATAHMARPRMPRRPSPSPWPSTCRARSAPSPTAAATRRSGSARTRRGARGARPRGRPPCVSASDPGRAEVRRGVGAAAAVRRSGTLPRLCRTRRRRSHRATACSRAPLPAATGGISGARRRLVPAILEEKVTGIEARRTLARPAA